MTQEIEPVSDSDVSMVGNEVVVRQHGELLFRLAPVPDRTIASAAPASAASLAAIESMATASPQVVSLLRTAVANGQALQVTFPKEVLVGLRTGTLKLMATSTGQMATAVDGAGQVVAHGRVVGGLGAAGVGGAAGAGLAGIGLTAAAALVLPVAIAGAAAYAQQRRVERALESIQKVVDRIETRMIDNDDGAIDAAEAFMELCAKAADEGGFTDQLRREFAVHRATVEGIFRARRRNIARLKARIESDQTKLERKTGKRQPWVDAVVEAVKDDKFDDELIRFLRVLICRTKLNALEAICLAEEGRPRSALELIASTERELRAEFFDLHNRLAPLARIEPERNVVLQRVPGLGKNMERAQETVKALVAHMDEHVLPIIPDPDHDRDVLVHIDVETLRMLGGS